MPGCLCNACLFLKCSTPSNIVVVLQKLLQTENENTSNGEWTGFGSTLFFFNKNKLNKNIEAEIARKIRTI